MLSSHVDFIPCTYYTAPIRDRLTIHPSTTTNQKNTYIVVQIMHSLWSRFAQRVRDNHPFLPSTNCVLMMHTSMRGNAPIAPTPIFRVQPIPPNPPYIQMPGDDNSRAGMKCTTTSCVSVHQGRCSRTTLLAACVLARIILFAFHIITHTQTHYHICVFLCFLVYLRADYAEILVRKMTKSWYWKRKYIRTAITHMPHVNIFYFICIIFYKKHYWLPY